MNEIFDFITSAAPYFVIGFTIAYLAANYWREKDSEGKSPKEKYLFRVGLIWFALAVFTLLTENRSDFTVYMCIGFMFFALSFNEKRKREDKS